MPEGHWIRRRLLGTLLTAAGALLPALGASGPLHHAATGAGLTAKAESVYAAAAPTAPVQASAALKNLLTRPKEAVVPGSTPWLVGFAKHSVDPRPCPAPAGQQCDLNANFHLGGFGLGPTRTSTGPMVSGSGVTEHIYARAMAISNSSGHSLLLAAIENQGTFAAYKQGPFGLFDIRRKVSQLTGVPIESIVINTDHSHAGPDLIGLWGGVPVSYLQLVHDQAVQALVDAYRARVPATLLVGSNDPTVPTPAVGGYVAGTATPGEFLDHSQFDADRGPISALQSNGVPVPTPPNPVPDGSTSYRDDLVDTQLRVLQAYDLQGHPLGTLINYAAHATVMGSSNVRYSADWPGRAADAAAAALGEPVALTMVADVGRTQPPRPISDAQCGQAGHISCEADKLDTWTRLMTPWVLDAVAHAQPLHGTTVASREILTRELATNPALMAVGFTGEVPVRGYGAYRTTIAPWITGDVVGTFVSSHRLGDILLTANPGEAYPDIRFGVLKSLHAPQVAFTFGLANDQLGYLIAPASEYPWIAYSNVGNDNSFFNVSAQYGDHIMCTQLAESLELGFTPTGDPQPYGPNAVQPVCPLLTATDVLPMGKHPQVIWPFGDGIALPPPAPQ